MTIVIGMVLFAGGVSVGYLAVELVFFLLNRFNRKAAPDTWDLRTRQPVLQRAYDEPWRRITDATEFPFEVWQSKSGEVTVYRITDPGNGPGDS